MFINNSNIKIMVNKKAINLIILAIYKGKDLSKLITDNNKIDY